MDSALLLPHLLNDIDVNTHNAERPILDFLVTFSGVVHWVWPITRSKATPITVNLLQSTVILSAINVTQTFRLKVSVAVLQLWYILGPSKLLRIPYLLTVTKTSYQFKGWLVQFKISPSSNSENTVIIAKWFVHWNSQNCFLHIMMHHTLTRSIWVRWSSCETTCLEK